VELSEESRKKRAKKAEVAAHEDAKMENGREEKDSTSPPMALVL
jgi:hypothetical protein